MTLTRANLIIHGKVQGVFFRASTQDKCQALGLSGWVRNLPLMRVEAEMQGPEERVREAIAWCHQGPAGAKVTRVEVNWREPMADESGFEVRY